MLLFPFFHLLAIRSAKASSVNASRVYDYVIVGGGTCGLVLANRLSADPSVSLAVIEAGESQLKNASVAQIENYFASLGTSIDWKYQSEPQLYTDNRTQVYDQGKALGGTSTINGATYIRAQKGQIDAWEQLGNDGWNWDSLWPYYLKSEDLEPPSDALQASTGFTYNPAFHGSSGPVGIGISNYTMMNSAHTVLNETWKSLGVPWSEDQNGGELRGFSVFPSTMDASRNVRADAARSYYAPITERTNLDVYTSTVAEYIVWADDQASQATATGIAIKSVNATDVGILTAKKEVILSAGTLKSPVILENSGIGNPEVLKDNGIDVKISLPAVGENLQDQPNVNIAASAQTNWTGYTPFVAYLTASDLFSSNTSNVASYIADSIPSYASMIANQAHDSISAATVQTLLRIQADLIFNQSVPCAEVLLVPLADTILSAFWCLIPFSRGSVHIAPANASSAYGPAPLINPNFFMLDWDAISTAATAQMIRKVFHQAPLSDYVAADILPNTTVVPTNASFEQWTEYFKQTYTPNYHPVGTCAMMSKDLGGVVSPEMIVYGTANVRVVDASILPFQIDGHLTSTLYAVAERASDLIIGTNSSYRSERGLL